MVLTQGKQPVLQAQHAVIDCCLQALEAREAGLAEVCKLLAAPEDLVRLEQLRAEVMPAAAAAAAAATTIKAAAAL